MPISFDLELLRATHNCVNYFETGLYDPRENVSIHYANRANFNKIFSLEIRADWVTFANQIFANEVSSGRITLINDDSNYLGKYLSNETFQHKTIFFFDAHVDNSNIHKHINMCPLINELTALKTLQRKDHVILIDDLRILRNPFPWNEQSYGNINFIDKIKELILEINPAYIFGTLDGHVKDDVLLAYIK
jgi:hypothetical protein